MSDLVKFDEHGVVELLMDEYGAPTFVDSALWNPAAVSGGAGTWINPACNVTVGPLHDLTVGATHVPVYVAPGTYNGACYVNFGCAT